MQTQLSAYGSSGADGILKANGPFRLLSTSAVGIHTSFELDLQIEDLDLPEDSPVPAEEQVPPIDLQLEIES